MLPVLAAEEMRLMDLETISQIGIPGAVLMENAGRAVAAVVRDALRQWPGAAPLVAVLCGAGNNGGDGFVAARVLHEAGIDCEVFLVLDESLIQGDALTFLTAYRNCGGSVQVLGVGDDLDSHSNTIEGAAIIVDAIFGTGLSRPVEGPLVDLFAMVNECSAPIVSVDVPSGVAADTGATLGACIAADVTVAMAAAKVANVGAPGFVHNGRLEIAEIGIPGRRIRAVAQAFVVEADDVASAFPSADGNVHKGRKGHVLAVAGSRGKQGAGRLAALAALRAGAGLVTLGAEGPDTQAADPIMSALVSSASELDEALAGKSALLMGPGMSTSEEGEQLVWHALAHGNLPMVLDADALNHLSADVSAASRATAPLVLTPHPGEAGRLLGISTDQVQADRMGAVRALAQKTGAVVVLKGARTCICDGRSGGKAVLICGAGGPELATAGTGDVLAGMVAALLAQGWDAAMAATVATYWHGLAGSVAKTRLGGSGVIASDVVDAIPASRAQLLASD